MRLNKNEYSNKIVLHRMATSGEHPFKYRSGPKITHTNDIKHYNINVSMTFLNDSLYKTVWACELYPANRIEKSWKKMQEKSCQLLLADHLMFFFYLVSSI